MSDLSFSSLMGGAKSGKSAKSDKSAKSKRQKGGSALAQTGGDPPGADSEFTRSLAPLQMGGRSRRYRKSKARRPKKSQSRKSKRRSPSKGAFPNGIFRNVFK